MGLPQAARWKTASDKEITSLEERGVFNLVPITSVPAGHKVVGTRWVWKIKADSTYKGRLVVQGFSQSLCMSVTRDRDKGTITISQKGYTEDVVQPCGMEDCNPACNPRVGLELSLNQPEEKILNEVEKRRYQAVTGAVHTGAVHIIYAVNQLARAMPKSVKAQMRAAVHLLCYLAGSTHFFIIFKQGGLRLAVFLGVNWGNNPDNSSLRHHTS